MAKRKSAKKQQRHIQQVYWLVAGAAVLGVVTGIIVLQLNKGVAPYQVAQVSQTMTNPAVSLQVQSVTEMPARELMTGKVIEDEKGLVVRLHVENHTNNNQPFLPVHQVFLKDRNGTLYQMAPVSGVNDPIKAGDLKSNTSIEGDISFMVDKSAEGLWLYLDTRWDNSLPIAIAL